MTNKKSTKKALITSALCLLLCMSMLVGTTFAWFTDEVKSGTNIIAAGNLDIELYHSDDNATDEKVNSGTKLFDDVSPKLWEPGAVAYEILTVKNEGTLALMYNLAFHALNATVVNDKSLADALKVAVVDEAKLTDRESAIAAGNEAGWSNLASFDLPGTLAAEASETYGIVIYWLPTANDNDFNMNNENQGKTLSVELGVHLTATQLMAEEDSYGPDYDANAKLPITNAEDLAAAMTEGGIYILAADIDVDSNTTMTVPAGKEVVLNLNGHEINAVSTETGKNRNVFTVKGSMVVTGEGTLSTVHGGTNMEWNNATSIFSVEGGELTLGEGVAVVNNGGSNMAYGVDVNTTLGESVLNINGATILSTYTAVREFNNHKTAQAIVNFNSGLVAGDSRDIWVHNPSASAIDANGIVNNNSGVAANVTVQTASYNGRIYDFDYGYILVNGASALQKALDNAEGEVTIKFGTDIKGDVTATQKADVKITIDGNGNEFAGVLTVDGKSARYETAALTIQNIHFNAESISADAYIRLGHVDAARYTNHVTVKDCTFSGDGIVAVKSYTGGDWNVTLENLTVNAGMHSLAQLKNVEKNLVVAGCKVYSKNGLNVNNSNNLTMADCIFDVQGYAVRFGSDANTTDETFTITGCTLKSACAESGDAVIEIRKGASNCTLNLTDTTIEGTVEMKGHESATINK